MTYRRRALVFLLAVAIGCSLACGDSGQGTSPNPEQASVSIALNPPPASTTIAVGNTSGIQFTPVVSNDPGNNGVDWAVTCSLNTVSESACGTLNIPTFHSASGTAVTYVPPATLSTGTLTVNVTVFATADHTKNVTTAVSISSYTAALNGTYILQVQGSDPNPYPYQSTGVFVFDGSGNITSGQQTLNTAFGFSSTYTLQGSSGTPSTYFIGPDGRGSITLNLQQASTGTTYQETFTFTVISSAQSLVAELNVNAGMSGSGTLELQDQTAIATMPTGAYAFVTNGSDSGSLVDGGPPGFGTPVPTAFGGVFNIDNNPSTGSISGNGSLADQDYYNPQATRRVLLSCAPPTGVTGSVSQPAAMGIVTITLTGASCFGLTPPGSIQFTGYIVDATHIRLIETDDLDGNSGFLTAGIAVSQGIAAGTFTNASLTGPYVFGVLGYDVNSFVPSSFTSVSVVNADGNGNFTGITDTLFLGESGAFTASTLTGTYVTDIDLAGRVDLTPKFSGLSPKPKAVVLLYLTGNGTPPLLLWSEGADINFSAVGTGIGYPQAANASTFSFGNHETYGFNLTQNVFQEIDGSGEMLATINGIAGTLTGTIEDFNNNEFNGGGAVALSDTFTLPADSFGRIAGTFMNVSGNIGPSVEYYMVDDNHGFLVETDLLTLGQTTLGYFTQSCDVTNAVSCQAAQKSSRRYVSQGSASRSVNRNPKSAGFLKGRGY